MLIRPDPASVLESVPEDYTPGPWNVVEPRACGVIVASADGHEVADVARGGANACGDADAVLIALAPTLVAALRVAVEDTARLQADLDEVFRWAQSGPGGCAPYRPNVGAMLARLDESYAQLAEVEQDLRRGRDEAQERALEAERVCDQPGCRAAVVRRDDGARVCGAGHASRWVERAELDAAHRGYAAYVATTERENDKELAAIQRLVKERDDARRERDEAINRAETWDQTLRPMCIDLATIDAVLAGTEDAPVEEGEVAARVLALREERDEARQHAEESEEVLGRIEEELDRAVSIRAPRRDGDDDHRIVRAVVRLREERDDARAELAATLADLRERVEWLERATKAASPGVRDFGEAMTNVLRGATNAIASGPAGDALARIEHAAEERGRLAGVVEERARVAELEATLAGDKQLRIAAARAAGLDLIGGTPPWDTIYEAHLSAIVAERDELALTLANERGEGPPPSDGWEWRVENTEGFWHRPGEPRRDVNRCYCDREDERIGRLRWHWWIVSGTYEAPEIHGSGWEDTAHAAMIAADAAGGDRG